MSSKALILVVITIVAASTCALGWHYLVDNNKQKELTIRTIGLDELKIDLQSPYGTKSPQHVLLINRSSHHILACEILYEFIPSEGQPRFSRKIVAYDYPLEEKDTIARKGLLQSEPGIRPNSKMLIGMGSQVDLVPVSDSLPHLPTASSVDETFKSRREKLEQLVIRINAVVLEDGKAFGPNAEQFLAHLRTTVLQKEKP